MQKERFDFISLYGLLLEHVIRFRRILIVFALLALVISGITAFNKTPILSGEFIIRIGDQSDNNISDIILVLNQRSLQSGLDIDLFSSNEEYKKLFEDLEAFRSIETSTFNRSNYKVIVSYEVGSDFDVAAEEIVLEAFKYNETLNKYITDQVALIDRELAVINASIEGRGQVDFGGDSMSNVNSSDILLSRFALSDMADLSQIRLNFELMKSRLMNFTIVSSIEYQSSRVLKLRYFLLNLILILFGGLLFTFLLSVHSEYKKR